MMVIVWMTGFGEAASLTFATAIIAVISAGMHAAPKPEQVLQLDCNCRLLMMMLLLMIFFIVVVLIEKMLFWAKVYGGE